MTTTVAPSLTATSAARSRRGSRSLLALGLFAIGVGLAAVSVLGSFGTPVIDYHVTETLRNQTIGLDAVLLFVVAPLSVVAALCSEPRRGRRAAAAACRSR